MKDVELAKKLLINDKTLVLVKDDKIIESSLNGIKPLINILNDGIDVSGYSIADKIVGKAQSMLIIKANIKEVYAKVLSKDAKELLTKYSIPFAYETLTDKIINRQGNDICPMEKIVKDIYDIDEAYIKLKEKVLTI